MSKAFFVIAGAQRSGTTYLYEVLDQHPQIEMAKPQKPEPKFFLYENEFIKGRAYYLKNFYSEKKGTTIYGEKSTSYIESAKSAQRIFGMFPDAKVIFVLRNPVLRAISNYFFSVKNNIESRTLTEVFVEHKPVKIAYTTSVSPYSYMERGEYARYLVPYFDIFGRAKVKIILFEEMIENSEWIEDIFRFLEVNPQFKPESTTMKINANDEYEVDPKIRVLLHQHFQPHNDALEKLVDIDLTRWK